MDVLIDTHLCLVCQTTLIGLDNYVIHKRNGCTGRGPEKVSDVSKISDGSGQQPCNNSLLSSQNYQHDELHKERENHYNLQRQLSHPESISGQNADHYGDHSLQRHCHAENSSREGGGHYRGHSLQTNMSHTQSSIGDTSGQYHGHSMHGQSSHTHTQGNNGSYTLATSVNGSIPALAESSGLSSNANQGGVTFLHHSESHLTLESANHSLSSLIGVHQSTDHYHSNDHHELNDLSHLQGTNDAIHAEVTSSSGHKLPSIRSFRSSARLLPSIPRESEMDSTAESLNASLPFSQLFHGNREHLGQTDHLGINVSHQALPSNIGFNLATTEYNQTSLTNPYPTGPHTTMALTSTSSHDMLPQSMSQAAGLEVAVASLVSTLSPTTSRVVDPNMVLYDSLPDKDTTFTDFFSSLELQYRVDVKTSLTNDNDLLRVGVDGRSDIDHNKALHIANIINGLSFSSDSDNILPSDTENLFDSSDNDGDDDEGMVPPTSHTGGKWVPGQKQYSPKSDSTIVLIPSKWNPFENAMEVSSRPVLSAANPNNLTLNVNTGKIRTGLGKGKAMGGKLKTNEDTMQNSYFYENDMEDTDNEVDMEEQNSRQITRRKYTSRGKVFPPGKIMPTEKTYCCKPCKQTLLNKVSYERHCSTTSHIKRTKNQDTSTNQADKEKVLVDKSEPENIECTFCNKMFTNRYNFARHLVSGYHQRKTLPDHKGMLLDEQFQILLLRQSRFQCHICQFYCNTSDQLKVHVFSNSHTTSLSNLTGPLLCVWCKFASRNNTEMLDHLDGMQHNKNIEDRPCVLRESRYRVQCRSCESTFESATMLKKHNETVHGNQQNMAVRKVSQGNSIYNKGRPICPYCLTKWSTFASMDRHIKAEHKFEKPYRCEECNRAYVDRSGLNAHHQSKKHLDMLVQLGDVRPLDTLTSPKKKKRVKVTHKCKLCDFAAENYSDLRPHFLQNHMSSVLECTTCGVKFVSEPAFKRHMNSKYHKQMEEDALGSVTTFTCNICGKKSYNSKKFVLHKLVHRYIIQNNEKDSLRQVRMAQKGISGKYKDFLSSIESVTPAQRVNCPLCKRAITKQQIFTHLRIHDGVSPFGCIYCAATFACPKSLQRHLAGHLGIKCLKCEICNKKFSRDRAFLNHMKFEHVTGKPKPMVSCATCGKSVSHKWKLRLHILSHTKPVRCKKEGCLMRFRCESQMLVHYRVHTGLKPHLCDECGYAAQTKQHLNRHYRTHTGERLYQCEYCNYRAINSTNLGRHMRIHIGAKPFKCPYCTLTCNTLENLRKHVMKTKKHAGKPVYLCKVCGEFGSNSALEFKHHLVQVHDVSEKGIDVISEYAGLYNKTEDVKTVAEGALVIPRKERWSAQSKKTKKKCKIKIKGHT